MFVRGDDVGPARAPELSAPFGGPTFRSRFTDAVWQGPTWSFAILLLVVRLAETSEDPVRATSWFVVGFVLVMAATAVALLVRWERQPVWVQPVVPLVDLVGAAVMVVADPVGAPSVILLCSLPAVWLAFEFGRTGLGVAVGVTALAGALAHVLRPDDAGPATGSGVVIETLFVIGLAVTARLMSRVLQRIGGTMRAQALEVDRSLGLAEERLELLTGVLASIDVGVVVLEPGSRPRLNDQARAATARMQVSLDAPEAGGVHVYDDDGITPVPVAEQAVSRAAAGEEYAGLLQRIGPPGDQLVLSMSAGQVARADGTPWATVLTAWDATDLMDAIRVREEFLTTVSHELRTPLTAITTSMEVLTDLLDEHPARRVEGDRTASESERLLAAVNRNTGLLRARIDQLLSSAQSTRAAFRPVRTDVAALVRASLEKHAAEVAASGLTLHDQVEHGLVAELDPTRVEQVVDNLVSNAAKYSRPGGAISVSLTSDETCIVLCVSDTGTGMTLDEQRQAFDRFYRAPRARAEAISGLGVGLGLVKTIVERHRGSVDLSSTLGRGTTVTVRLPGAARP